MRIAALVTQPRGGPVDHAVDVACELAARGYDSRLIGPLAAYADRLARAGVGWDDITVATKGDVVGARRLRRRLRELDPSVLHLQDRRAGLVGRLLGRAAPRIVYSVHGVADSLSDLVAGNARAAERGRFDVLQYIGMERVLDRLTPTEMVVPCSPVGTYLVETVRLPRARIQVVANGIDADRFRPRPRVGPDRTTVLWLGLMAEVKRVQTLIEAVRTLPSVHLLLVGDGPQRAELERLVTTSAELRERVEFRGHVDDPAPVFAEADLFALPSAAEALPLSLLQAMSSELAVVATTVGGIPDVIRPGVDGLLVGPDDLDALRGALSELVDDPDQRRKLAASARRRVLDRFTLATCVDGLLQAYRA